MASLSIKNEGGIVGAWAQSVTRCSASIQADRTSASLMLYPNEGGRRGLNDPFIVGVSHSIDKDETRGYIQVPALHDYEKTRYFTFQEFVAVMDSIAEVERLKGRIDALEAALHARS